MLSAGEGRFPAPRIGALLAMSTRAFGKANGRHHPLTAITLQTLPCELANVGTAGGVGASQAASQRSITLIVIRAGLGEQAGTHPLHGV